ncbi:MAG: LOG family protein [Parcubacteria group bacterium]
MNQRTVIVPGTVIERITLQTAKASIHIAQSAPGDIAVETSGIVLAIAGGGTFPPNHPICREVQSLAQKVAASGGIIVNGGTMLAAAEVAPDITVGVACPYHKLIPFGKKALVSNYQSRKMIISAMPHVVAFEGQVGTLDELTTTIGWIKSLTKQGNSPPELWAQNYWRELIKFLSKKKAVQHNVLMHIHSFSHVHKITF